MLNFVSHLIWRELNIFWSTKQDTSKNIKSLMVLFQYSVIFVVLIFSYSTMCSLITSNLRTRLISPPPLISHNRCRRVWRTLKTVYPNLVDISCIVHTINIAGGMLSNSNPAWIYQSLEFSFAHSAIAHLCWKEQCGSSAPTYTPMHWWSKLK